MLLRFEQVNSLVNANEAALHRRNARNNGVSTFIERLNEIEGIMKQMISKGKWKNDLYSWYYRILGLFRFFHTKWILCYHRKR